MHTQTYKNTIQTSEKPFPQSRHIIDSPTNTWITNQWLITGTYTLITFSGNREIARTRTHTQRDCLTDRSMGKRKPGRVSREGKRWIADQCLITGAINTLQGWATLSGNTTMAIDARTHKNEPQDWLIDWLTDWLKEKTKPGKARRRITYNSRRCWPRERVVRARGGASISGIVAATSHGARERNNGSVRTANEADEDEEQKLKEASRARTPSAGLTSRMDDISFIHPYAPCHPNSVLMQILSSKCNGGFLVGPILFFLLVNFFCDVPKVAIIIHS